jgi:hypothetical protein
MAGSGEIYFPSVLIYLKILLALSARLGILSMVMNKSYFTQQEDGSFRPVNFNQSNLADIIADVIGHEFKSALADKVAHLIADIDLSGRVRDAVDGVDIDDIATDAIREEVTARIENMDISVDVSI